MITCTVYTYIMCYKYITSNSLEKISNSTALGAHRLIAVIPHATLQHALAAQFPQAGVELNGCHAELALVMNQLW